MSFEEELKAAIEGGLAAQQEEADSRKAFWDQWLEERKTVLAILQRAAGVFHETFGDGEADLNNGGVYLRARRASNGQASHRMIFKPDLKRKEIQLSMDLEGETVTESIPLEAICEASIQDKVKQFASTIARIPKRTKEFKFV